MFVPKPLALLAAMAFLMACSTPTVVPQPSGDYLFTVALRGTESQSQLEQIYKARAISFKPDAGFAIFSGNTKPSPNDTAVLSVSDNAGLVGPENDQTFVAYGESTGMAGWSTWAGGWAAWAGGWTSWAGGWTSWTGGTTAVPALPEENKTQFEMINLPVAHFFAKKFGAGVKVAVLDTGVDTTHPGLAGRLAPSNQWRDFVDGDNYPQEVQPSSGMSAYGHGTAVAGLILQVAPKATILPLRVLNANGSGNTDALVQAIDYAITAGANIINISAGSLQSDQAVYKMLSYARSKGVYTVASAGNNGQTNGGTYPARYSYWQDATDSTAGFVFGVGSLASDAKLSGFSSRGDGIVAYMPGEKLTTFGPDNRIMQVTGTSFAAPLFAGGLALAYGELPNVADRSKLGKTLIARKALDTEHIWKRIYKDKNLPWEHGEGFLDVARLLFYSPGVNPNAAAPNLLSNPGFESGLVDWNAYGPTSVVSNSGLTGGVKAAGFAAGMAGWVGRTLTGLTPNSTYMVTVKTRADNNTDLVCLNVSKFNQANAENSEYDCSNNSSFESVYVQFTTGASDTSAVLDLGRPSSGGHAYADDVRLSKIR